MQCFFFVDQFLVFDHQEQEIYLVCLSDDQTNAVPQRWFDEMEVKLRRCTDAIDTQPLLPPQERMSLSFSLARSHKDYMNDIRICKKYLRDGDSYEICLTNTIETHADVDGFELYRVLRQRNPTPYAAYLRFGETQILCSSPERYLRIDREQFVETKPIKGTCPRGKTPEKM